MFKFIDKKKREKIDALDKAVYNYCIEYTRATDGRCDGKCPFTFKCSREFIQNHPRMIQNTLKKLGRKW